MPKPSAKTSFYKQAEFLSGDEFNASADVQGFSVRYNQPFFEHDLFRFHFRSDFLAELLIVKGKLTFSLNLEQYTAKQNSLLIIAPNAIKKIALASKGKMRRIYDSVHKNMPIEQIIDLTWQPKEKVPQVAAPRMGGPLSFWKPSLISLEKVLSEFGNDLHEDELRLQAHPHPISGSLVFQQRIEFLRFHINRHKDQVSQLISKM
jgi:hypothetical protein